MDISVLLAIRAIMDNANIDIYLEVFVWTDVFISFGYITISEIAGSYGNFLIIRGTNRLFFKATAPFYIQQCTRVSVSPHLRQHLSSVFFITAILVGVK